MLRELIVQSPYKYHTLSSESKYMCKGEDINATRLWFPHVLILLCPYLCVSPYFRLSNTVQKETTFHKVISI